MMSEDIMINIRKTPGGPKKYQVAMCVDTEIAYFYGNNVFLTDDEEHFALNPKTYQSSNQKAKKEI